MASPGSHREIPIGYRRGEAGFLGLLREQEGRCAICNALMDGALKPDHDHSNGMPRGLLCGPCNTGLGYFGDDPGRLQKAINYLLTWRLIHEAANQRKPRPGPKRHLYKRVNSPR